MTKKNELKWALIGLGKHAERLADAIGQATGQSLVAIVGKNRERVRVFAEKYSVPNAFNTLASLLKEKTIFDAICIASPNDEHAQQAIAALNAGKDVLCEKPLTLTLRDGISIMRAVKKNQICMVDYQLRVHPAVLEARRIILHDEIGELLFIDLQWSIGVFGEEKLPSLPRHMRWRESISRAGGGAVMARGVHLFDLIRFLSGKEVTSVRSSTDAVGRTVDRTALGILEIQGEIPAVIVTSKNIPAARNAIVIYGRHGRLTLNIFDTSQSTLEIINQRGTRLIKYPAQNLYTNIFDSFAAAREGRDTPLATVRDGVAAVAITESFLRSARTGKAEMVGQSSIGRLRKSTSMRRNRAKRKV